MGAAVGVETNVGSHTGADLAVRVVDAQFDAKHLVHALFLRLYIARKEFSFLVDLLDDAGEGPVRECVELDVSVLADSCLVAGAASTLGMLFGVDRGEAWLRELGVPFLCVRADGTMTGTLAAA